MKKYVFILILLFLSNLWTQQNSSGVRDGLYYGRKRWFFPPILVYALKKDSLFSVECYFAFKAVYISLLKDTLYNIDEKYIGKSSQICLKGKKLYFYPPPDSFFKIRSIKLKYRPQKMERLNYIRKYSRDWDEVFGDGVQ